MPLDQLAPPQGEQWRSSSMTLVVRSSSSPEAMVSAVTNAIREIDSTIPVTNVQSMEDLVTTSLSSERFSLLLLGAFALLALILAAIGIYSVLSYSVRRRVQEIGIRLALGASLSDVLRMVIFEGLRPTLLGVFIGIAGAFALARVMSNLIYGVKPTDPLTFVSVAFLLGVVALGASIIPAYRAAKVDPLVALRYE
jgi:putative ABC transport system permease protein